MSYYLAGLISSAVAIGLLLSSVPKGFIVLGVGLMIVGVFTMLLNYLNGDKKKWVD